MTVTQASAGSGVGTRVRQVLGSRLNVRAGRPLLGDVTVRRVRADFWATLQRNLAVMVARSRPDSTKPIHDGVEKSRHVLNAVAAFVAAHENSDELLEGLASLGQAAGESLQPEDIEACASAVGHLVAKKSPYVAEGLKGASK